MMELPIAVIGAGPVGLAAAANLVSRGLAVKVYEAGTEAGASIRDWGHVRLFSPWVYNVDPAARSLLMKAGWQVPESTAYPTGEDLVREYLVPLSRTTELAPVIEYGARVRGIGRRGIDKVVSRDRELHPFELTIVDSDGRVRRELARAVIDASGTWTLPNPLGAGGVAAEGEEALADRIAHGIPDVLGRDRARYAGRTTVVVGAGHSAANVLLDLVELAAAEPATAAIWLTRSNNLSRVYGAANDQLAARGDLGQRLRQLVEAGGIKLVTSFAATAVREEDGQLTIDGETPDGLRSVSSVDQIVVCTGQRPDLTLTRELRVELDPWLESAKALGPMIDPNLHSCGSVPPHGHRELSHPSPASTRSGSRAMAALRHSSC